MSSWRGLWTPRRCADAVKCMSHGVPAYETQHPVTCIIRCIVNAPLCGGTSLSVQLHRSTVQRCRNKKKCIKGLHFSCFVNSPPRQSKLVQIGLFLGNKHVGRRHLSNGRYLRRASYCSVLSAHRSLLRPIAYLLVIFKYNYNNINTTNKMPNELT